MKITSEQMNNLIGYQKIVSAWTYLAYIQNKEPWRRRAITDAILFLRKAEISLREDAPFELIDLAFECARYKYLYMLV